MASEHVAILTGPLRTNMMVAIVGGVLGTLDVRINAREWMVAPSMWGTRC